MTKIVVTPEENEAWRQERLNKRDVGRVATRAQHAKLTHVELDARAERLTLEHDNPWLLNDGGRTVTAFQVVSIGMQAFMLCVVLAVAAKMLAPTLPTNSARKAPQAGFAPGLPE